MKKRVTQIKIILIRNFRYLSHSVVLAAVSQYLNSKIEEIETDPRKEIFLDDVNATATLAMIEFCYTGKIGIYFFLIINF